MRSQPTIETGQRLTYHFIELSVLHHHGVNNAKETFIRGEYRRPTGQRIALHKTLTQMLAQHFDYPSAPGIGVLAPLEISARVGKHSIQLVALKLIRAE